MPVANEVTCVCGHRVKRGLFRALSVSCLLLSGVCATNDLRADVFELKDGRRVEGTILAELGSLISVKQEDGSVVTFDAEEVKARESSHTVIDVYLAKKEELKKDDVAGHLELARWCVEGELLREAVFHFKSVLKSDANHAEARKALGYEKVRGEWYFSGPEAEAAKQDKPDAKPRPRMREIPENVELDVVPKPTQKPVAVVGEGLSLVLAETVMGEPAKLSPTHHHVNKYLRSMREPMSVLAGKGGAFTLEGKLDIKFVRTHYFYGTLPMSNIFEGSYDLQLKDSTGKVIARFKKDVSFSSDTRTPKEKSANYAHYYTVQRLIDQISKHQFFRGRGAPARPDEG